MLIDLQALLLPGGDGDLIDLGDLIDRCITMGNFLGSILIIASQIWQMAFSGRR